jgi:signal transduction histidine kinase
MTTTGWGRRARALDWRALDAGIAVLLAGAAVAAVAASEHPGAVSLVAAAAFAATVAWRRRAPAAAILAALVSVAAVQRAGGPELAIAPIVALLDYYTLGRRSGERGWAPAEPLLLALAIPVLAASPSNPHLVDVASVWAFFFVAPFGAGRAIGSRGALTRELRGAADRLAREQRERASRAAAEERTRIARELHDVVAHSVSVMVVQTQAARRVAGADREAARAALRSVESCGRDALVDMRRMIGVLRRGDIELAAPGLAQLDTLAARARASGLPVELRIEGEPRLLPPAVDLVAFRVVQEALTNALKHAGPAHATVLVAYTDGALVLEISDTGHGPPSASAQAEAAIGHGLIGMRERLTLYGGELRTGRRRGGGFQVQAHVPLGEALTA